MLASVRCEYCWGGACAISVAALCDLLLAFVVSQLSLNGVSRIPNADMIVLAIALSGQIVVVPIAMGYAGGRVWNALSLSSGELAGYCLVSALFGAACSVFLAKEAPMLFLVISPLTTLIIYFGAKIAGCGGRFR